MLLPLPKGEGRGEGEETCRGSVHSDPLRPFSNKRLSPGRGIVRAADPALVSALLKWFREHSRDLPWRRTRDPYGIWVSEIMLQQTQVKTVIPYWERWMRRLPDLQTLAKARIQTVLKLWEGLGYYHRARNMHHAAQTIVTQHAGRFPDHFGEVLALPGIGRYTAGAICSIAFNQPVPVLDGNVIRVLARVFGLSGNPRAPATNADLWGLAGELVQMAAKAAPNRSRPCSQLNQALMELGALVCTPTQPKCPACPARSVCLAHITGQTESLPNLGDRRSATTRLFAAFIVEHRGRFLVRQRPAGVVNALLWEFPNVEITDKRSTTAYFGWEATGIRLSRLQPFCVIKHTITRYRITLKAYRTRMQRRPIASDERSRWLTVPELNRLPFAGAHRKMLIILESQSPIPAIGAKAQGPKGLRRSRL